MSEIKKKSDITIRVGLDDNNLPVALHWLADEDKSGVPNEIKAMLLAVYDAKTDETLKIDLWTKEFQVGQMNQFVFEFLHSLSDTYFRATKNEEMKAEMKAFALHFGKTVGLISPEDE